MPLPKHHKNEQDESIKETLESVVMAFVLAFVFRAYVVEAFVIPTGSMAPTLLGEHMAVYCSQCGHHFDVDVQKPDRYERVNDREYERSYITADGLHAVCPMCHFPNPVPFGTQVKAGDRILVHKYIYSLSEPRRWDVVVFKNPSSPEMNFIKRLAGLPNERLWIIDGNVYVQPTNEPDAAWRIARKSDREKVQRAVWQPIYHSDSVPLDDGNSSPRRNVENTWACPWRSDDEGKWDFSNRRSYRFAGHATGQLHFDFNIAAEGGCGLYPYNQFGSPLNEPLEDVRVAAVFHPVAPGLSVTLTTTIRSPEANGSKAMVPVTGRIDADGRAWVEVASSGRPVQVKSLDLHPFAADKPTQVELWYVDQEASLWIDGRCVAKLPFDIDIDTLKSRPEPAARPQISIAVNGPAVTLHHVEVDRDLYYSSALPGSASSSKGTLVKWTSDGRRAHPEGVPVTLLADQFFCLGDNSPRSSDSRYWTGIHPWIRLRMFDDDPNATGIVPRKLMMGRAFFVYFPAMHGWSPRGWAVIPNFGDMRFIH